MENINQIKMKRNCLYGVFVMLFLYLDFSAGATDLYAPKNGNDKNPGTKKEQGVPVSFKKENGELVITAPVKRNCAVLKVDVN